jgi:hypothetical protein
MVKIDFCFKMAKELKLGENNETGEPCEVYTKVSITAKKEPSKEKYKTQHEGLRKMLAYESGANEKYIIPISKEEYAENVD